MSETFEMEPNECPSCHSEMDRVTNVHGMGAPEQGDATVCTVCGEILEFDENLDMVRATNPEVLADERLHTMQAMILEHKLAHVCMFRCPDCEALIKAVDDETKRPEPGNITICHGCFATLQFNEGMELELVERMSDEVFLRVMKDVEKALENE